MSISENIQLVSEPINKLLTPLASSAGKTLQDMWELVFGNFGNYVEKKRIVRLQALEDFKTSLETKVAAIPEERLCEPTLSIVGPALESSKYYFEEPDIREMFAKLISSAMDCETAPSVHPAFTEIIKQMSPLDAQNLSFFTGHLWLPVADYQLNFDGGVSKTLYRNIFLSNPNVSDCIVQAQSISSLIRLGLIDVSYENSLDSDSLYEGFEKTVLYCHLSKEFLDGKRGTLGIKRGLSWVTPIGKQFSRICVD